SITGKADSVKTRSSSSKQSARNTNSKQETDSTATKQRDAATAATHENSKKQLQQEVKPAADPWWLLAVIIGLGVAVILCLPGVYPALKAFLKLISKLFKR